MAKKKLRVGLIGAGTNMRRSHVPRIAADGAVELVAVADPVPEAAGQLVAGWDRDIALYDDWRRVLEHDLHAVVISTPHNVHYTQVRAALQSGLHVLVEKPLTISSRHSKALLADAERYDRMLVVAYQRHHMAAYRYARELIRDGRIGRIAGVAGYVTQNDFGRVDWRADPSASGGGMFADTGSHLMAAAMWVTGLEPRTVTAAFDHRDGPVDINGTARVEFTGGVLGTLAAFGDGGRHDERLIVSGSGGSLALDMHEWRFGSFLVNDRPVRIPRRVVDGTPDSSFFGWIRNGGRGYEPPVVAHRVVQLTVAAYRSAELKKPVHIEP